MMGKENFIKFIKIILAVAAWLLFIILILPASFFLGGVVLGIIYFSKGPALEVCLILLLVFSLCAATAWLVARFFSDRRFVLRLAAFIVTAMLIGVSALALTLPDDAEYLARTVVMGDSDVLDYQIFPERKIENAPPVFQFKEKLSPELFKSIRYTYDGQEQEADFDQFLASSKTTSFLVIKNDEILYEKYFNGYRRDSIVTSFSIAKSVTSALVGMAIDDGYIGSVDEPVIKYLPEMSGRGFDQMTIRDLLLMSSGIRFITDDETAIIQTDFPYVKLNPYHDEAASYEYTNMRKLALGLPASKEPVGAIFKYNQYYPLLLGLILERTTNQSPGRYLEEKIWKRIGMEYPASWSLDSEKYGFEKMESGINGRAIDFAKFGRLFLNEGAWDGKEIISAKWVKESTAPDPSDTRPWPLEPDWRANNGYYKYMWWGRTKPDGSYHYFARGHLGQLIAVSPKDKVIVVRFGMDEGPVDSWDDVAETIMEKIR